MHRCVPYVYFFVQNTLVKHLMKKKRKKGGGGGRREYKFMKNNNGKRRKSGSVQRTAAGPFVYLPVCFRTCPGFILIFQTNRISLEGTL